MDIKQLHTWDLTTSEAIAIQSQLGHTVITIDQLSAIKYVAGVDMGFNTDGTICKAAVVVLSFPELQLQEQAIATRQTTFPYIPGFLSFREIPAVLEALTKLNITPDLILCDGQGIAHPRRFGLACHLGVITNLPTIGVAKSLFIGTHPEISQLRGSYQFLTDENEIIGAVLRTRTNVKPVYVSIGHKISLTTAIDYVLKCSPKYRLPETTRLADQLAAF